MSDVSSGDESGQGSFDLGIDLLPGVDLDSLEGDRLLSLLDNGLRTRRAVRQRPAPEPKVARAVGLNTLQDADLHDLREAVRVLNTWLRSPGDVPEPAKRSRYERPEGAGQLPGPQCVKKALVLQACGLCSEPVKPGDLTGRVRPPKPPLDRAFVPMGWLCQHCLFDRRHMPRRRDVLIRFFHHLLNSSPVGLNSHECRVPHTWLTGSGACSSEAWKLDPLDTTLVRLSTSAAEDKANPWIAFPTSLSILRALQAGEADENDASVLEAILQHATEWETNPFGTGVAYRQQILKSTDRPTFLSVLGGPFFLHKAPDPDNPEEEEATQD
ncbi:hypothetical protein ACIOMM_30680 [Streptomyces sp. NPDC087908]|uniref:hypothetical protein n=1 Tax=Streptomyces sp. NPDC087908 TaxID=3365820 RepID=UPI0038240FE1